MFSIVMAYYDNLRMLVRQYENIAHYAKDVEYIVVDDCSPKYPALPPQGFKINTIPNFQLYRMLKDIRWNQDACRNIGVRHATYEWILLTDMDHLIPIHTVEYLLTGIRTRHLRNDEVYTFMRVNHYDNCEYKPHPNTWFMTKIMYWKCGGYDERFAGWYGTDGDFRDRVRLNAKKVMTLPHAVVRVTRDDIPDASTPVEYGRKGITNSMMIRQIKSNRNKIKGWKPLVFQTPYDRVR
jgi:hypothetical protein